MVNHLCNINIKKRHVRDKHLKANQHGNFCSRFYTVGQFKIKINIREQNQQKHKDGSKALCVGPARKAK